VSTTLTFFSISAGYYHTCGVATDSLAYCWGWNQYGQLADVDGELVTTRNVPARSAGNLTFASVYTSRYFYTCGLTIVGSVYCWGYRGFGALGDGNVDGSGSAPVLVVGNHSFVSLSTGWHHTCAAASTGAGYCWGFNEFGQIGDATLTMRLTPTRIAAEEAIGFIRVTAGHEHSCGLTSRGAVYCWGRNGWGQLGDGTFTDRSVPTLVRSPE
jgi:alpha-tubulin suppressor-like RCC1 family protein